MCFGDNFWYFCDIKFKEKVFMKIIGAWNWTALAILAMLITLAYLLNRTKLSVSILLSNSQPTAMSVLGEVGHLARPPAAGEPRTGRGNDNLKNFSTLKFLSQGDHCGRNKQWGKVRKAEDNRARRDRRLQRGLQSPWSVYACIESLNCSRLLYIVLMYL